MAANGNPVYKLPHIKLAKDSYDFSFSGLKSAVINLHNKALANNTELNAFDLAASFQEAVVEVLCSKTKMAAVNYNAKQIIVAGGVAANKGLRKALQEEFGTNPELELIIPPLSLCTDNAAMIAAVGSIMYEKGKRSGYDLNGNPGLDLEIDIIPMDH